MANVGSRWISEQQERLERELREAGLERLAAQLAVAAVPAVRLLAENPAKRISDPRLSFTPLPLADKLEASTQAFGRTRLGGLPDMPPGFEWPTRQRSRKQFGARIVAGAPLSFIAQVNLLEVPRIVIETGAMLPSTGMLWFFYDAENLSFGDLDDSDGFRVLYADVSTEELSPATMPEGLETEHGLFGVVPLSFAPELALPSGESEVLGRLGFWSRSFPEEEFEAYHEFVALRDTRIAAPDAGDEAQLLQAPVHRLLGHPNVIQGEMELECQFASHDIDSERYWAPIRAGGDPPSDIENVAKGAADWRLLLQIDSDLEAGMMWGDAGMLYYWIPEDALEKRKFHRAWNIMQCF